MIISVPISQIRKLRCRDLPKVILLVREELGFESRQLGPTVRTPEDLVPGLCMRKDLVSFYGTSDL